MERLFVYGTLRPGHSNAHIMDNIGGEWQPGYVKGLFYERGWGAARIFRGSCSTTTGLGSTAICSCPRILASTGRCWMRLKRATIALPWTLPPKTVSA